MFDDISRTYDIINHMLSFGIDTYWRNAVCAHVPKSEFNLLDLATGTGDQLFAIMKKSPHVKGAIGLDMAAKMLRLGDKKLLKKPYAHQVSFLEGCACDIPLESESVDCVTMSFGIRNVTSTRRCFEEIYRVLSPKGQALILEFSLPRNCIIRALHLFYLRRILPTLAGIISRKKSAYTYLNKTIETFPCGVDFCEKMQEAGFTSVTPYPLTFGIATIYKAEK